MFLATVPRTRAVSPAFRSFDGNFVRFINEAFSTGTRNQTGIEQDDKQWTLSLDVPGVSREELNIGIEGTVVRIETRADAKRQYKAAYELPQEIDVTASAARLENGVLTLTLAKQVPISRVTQLNIQ